MNIFFFAKQNVKLTLLKLLLNLVCDSLLNNEPFVQFLYHLSRWPEPIYMRVGYVFDLRFSE